MATFNCPNCGHSFRPPQHLLGQTIPCPSCNRRLRLPDPKPDPALQNVAPTQQGNIAVQDHQWYYFKAGMISDEHVGPIGEREFLHEGRVGTIDLENRVASPTRTNNQWCEMSQIPGCVKLWREGQAEREEAKRKQAEEREQERQLKAARKEQERQLAAARRQAELQQREIVEQRRHAAVSTISDCQDVALVERLHQEAQRIVTSNETIEYIAVQKKPVVNIKPDAVIATNRRLIFFRSKLLGQFEFQDYLWRDLHDAHLSQGILGSTFTARHVSGAVVAMDYLSKPAAATIYRLAQEREEQAFETRRQMKMEEMQAGAAKIAIQNNIEAQSPPPLVAEAMPEQGQKAQIPGPSNVGGRTEEDLVARLERLKVMLDKGLISGQDYETRKREILSQT